MPFYNTCHDYLLLVILEGQIIFNAFGMILFWLGSIAGMLVNYKISLQNQACAGMNPLCRTNGTGCIDGGLPCSSYKGTRA